MALPGIGLSSLVGNAAKSTGGGGGMSLGTIFAIVSGLNMLLSLFQPSQSKLMEKQGDVTAETNRQMMEDRLAMMEKMGVQPPYQSPYLGEMDPMVLKALMASLGRTANWGQPAGQQINTDFITQALSNIANIPSLSTGQSSPARYPDRPGAVMARGWIPPELNIGG